MANGINPPCCRSKCPVNRRSCRRLTALINRCAASRNPVAPSRRPRSTVPTPPIFISWPAWKASCAAPAASSTPCRMNASTSAIFSTRYASICWRYWRSANRRRRCHDLADVARWRVATSPCQRVLMVVQPVKALSPPFTPLSGGD